MLREIADWILRTMQLVEGQRKQQAKIIDLEKRVRDLEQAIEMMSEEARHVRELDAAHRENLLLRLENALHNVQGALPAPQAPGRKKRR